MRGQVHVNQASKARGRLEQAQAASDVQLGGGRGGGGLRLRGCDCTCSSSETSWAEAHAGTACTGCPHPAPLPPSPSGCSCLLPPLLLGPGLPPSQPPRFSMLISKSLTLQNDFWGCIRGPRKARGQRSSASPRLRMHAGCTSAVWFIWLDPLQEIWACGIPSQSEYDLQRRYIFTHGDQGSFTEQ